MTRIIPMTEIEEWKKDQSSHEKEKDLQKEYDDAMEQYLKDTRVARGYTDREPTAYSTSSVQRWKQDSQDWVDFRDRVMMYGLEIINKSSAGESIPSLEEFKAHLQTIECHWTYTLS